MGDHFFAQRLIDFINEFDALAADDWPTTKNDNIMNVNDRIMVYLWPEYTMVCNMIYSITYNEFNLEANTVLLKFKDSGRKWARQREGVEKNNGVSK